MNRQRLIDSWWLLLLAGYILIGTPLVPFHGDESTTLWMSRDYAYTVLQPDFERLRYSDPPPNPTEQQMRLITGSLTKYLMGVSWSSNGYTAEQINEQWDWGADWAYNQQFGHAPDDTLLLLGRWPAALMLAAGGIVIFALGVWIGGRPTAYLASLYYALNPALLLNARRAMFEGGLILFTLLVVWAGVWLLRQVDNDDDKQRGWLTWGAALLLGLFSGLAVSAKHPAVFTVAAVFAACGAYALTTSQRWRLLAKLVAAGVLSLVIFYALNPIWWGDPVGRVDHVLVARGGILSGQVSAFGDYETFTDRIGGFARQVFIAQPQYYEVDAWADYIGDQIATYEASPWTGFSIGGSVIGAVIVAGLVVVGFVALLRRPGPARWVVGLWSAVIMLLLALTTPLEWQRYFLVAYLPVGLLAALGLTRVAAYAVSRYTSSRQQARD